MKTSNDLEVTIQHFSFQSQASAALCDKLASNRGVLLQGGTGTGKTYIAAQCIKDVLPTLEADDKLGKGPFPVLWVCPAATKLQTERVLKAYNIQSKVGPVVLHGGGWWKFYVSRNFGMHTIKRPLRREAEISSRTQKATRSVWAL